MSISIRAEGFEDAFRVMRGAVRQIPFATSQAINETMKEAQQVQREHLHSVWTVRRRAWVDRGVKISEFSKRNTLTGRMTIDPPGGARGKMAKREDGGRLAPRSSSYLWIPAEGVRSNPARSVPKRYRPGNLNFRYHGKTRAGGSVLYGDHNTVMITHLGGGASVFRARKRERSLGDMRLMYKMTKRIELALSLSFVAKVRETIYEN